VLAEGDLAPGAPVELVARPYPALSVRRAALAMANRTHNRAEALLLARCEALAQDWRLRLAREGFRRSGGADAPDPD
jgi:MOSC domain-containing protein YiiM